MQKYCPRCKQNKEDSEFTGSSLRPDGLSSYCKDCANSYQKRYRDDSKKNKEPEVKIKRYFKDCNYKTTTSDYTSEGCLTFATFALQFLFQKTGKTTIDEKEAFLDSRLVHMVTDCLDGTCHERIVKRFYEII